MSTGARKRTKIRGTSGIKLPQGLLDQVAEGESSTDINRQFRKAKGGKNRKETRKQARVEKKSRKAAFFAHPPASGSSGLKREATESLDSRPRKKTKGEHSEESPPALLVHRALAPPSHKAQVKPKPTKTPKKTVLDIDPNLLLAGDDEDQREIARLEKLLGRPKKKKTRAKTGYDDIEDDGLDDLLLDIDRTLFSEGEGEEDQMSAEEDVVSDVDDSSIEEDSAVSVASESGSSEWGGIELQDDVHMPSATSDSASPVVDAVSSDDVVSKKSQTSAYVPPHLRKADAGNETESTVKLNRRINGLFNKMAEGNIALILQDVESLYQNHRRHDVTSTLTTLIIENISSHSELLDSYVTLYGCFVASLHHIIGIDFAAYFVQNVVSQYEHEYASLDATLGSDSYGKQCTNLAILISELYQFGVISCVLIYDIIRDLLESGLREFEVELLLKIVRASGTQLRKDDPSALKDIVDSVMQKIDTVDANRSSRAKFMLETLIDLKNNKMKRVTQDQGTTNTAERLKKFSEGVRKRHHTSSSEPLRVSLSDLRSADTKGKWWLIGSAWGGDPLVEHQKRVEETLAVHDQKSGGEVLLEIARKQGMNTDIRRSIFAVIMSSEDYVDACERLSQLNLKDVQQREIMRVIVQCCGKEKTYNPYYTLVGQQLCQTSHSHKITLQYCLWDFLRELGEKEAGGAEILKSNAATDVSASKQQVSSTRRNNVARAYAWWVAKGAVTLAILKPLDFAFLQPETQTFLRTFFSYVFIGTQTSSPILSTVDNLPRNPDTLIQVFSTTGRIQSLPEGIRFCLRNIFRKELKAKDSEDSFLRWAIGIADDALQSGVDLDVELS